MALHTRLSMLAIGALAATTAAAQHVLLPFSQHKGNDINLSARGSKQATLRSSDYPAYVVDATVGTPPQKVSLLISTSVGDTWVPDANTRECSPEWYYQDPYGYDDDEDFTIPEAKCTWGSFNKTQSSTYLPPNSRYDSFSADYIDYNSVGGYNMTDKLAFGGLEFNDYPMGLVSMAYRWIGMLGLGANNSVNYYSSATAGNYANIMDRMVSSGKIESPAYSIWLDDAKGTTGGLLFGAVDRSRYTGELVRLSASSSGSSSYYSYGSVTTLNSINGTTASGEAMPAIRSNDFPVDVTIGPGEQFSFLPSRLADQMAEMAGAAYNESAEGFLIPCDAGKTNNTKFVLELGGAGGPKLNVETADLVLPISAFTRYRFSDLLESDLCVFGIQKYFSSSSSSSSSSSVYNLGSSLLRRSYLVVDLANQEIAVAPVKFPSGSNVPASDIVAFESYGDYTPGASLLCTGSYCPDSDSGSGSGSGPGSGSNGPYKYDGPENGIQQWEKVAIGVGVTFGVLILAGVITGIILCTRSGRGKGVVPKEADEQGLESDTPPAPPTNPEMSQNTRGSMILPPGPLPSIQEGAEPHAQTQAPAPQLPALGTQLARPITPPEPTASANSNRPSVAVSALSQEQETQEHGTAPESEAAAQASPKGKGKAVERSEG